MKETNHHDRQQEDSEDREVKAEDRRRAERLLKKYGKHDRLAAGLREVMERKPEELPALLDRLEALDGQIAHFSAGIHDFGLSAHKLAIEYYAKHHDDPAKIKHFRDTLARLAAE